MISKESIPTEWDICSLGDYIYLKNGFAFKSNAYVHSSSDTVPIIRISDINGQIASDQNAIHVKNTDAVEGFEIINGDLLIAMSGATTGKVGIYVGNEPAYQNQRVGNIKLICASQGIEKFRSYLISSLSENISDIAYGGAQPNISGKAIEAIKIGLPSLAEQKQIATKLDELLAQVDTIKTRLDAIPTILKRFRQSVLAAAVSGKLTEDWRNTNDTQVLDGVSLPVSWRLKRASEACLKVQSGSTPKNKPFDQGGGVPFLKVYNIVNQQIDFNYKPQFVTKEVHTKVLKRSIAIPNDVLMNIVGPPLGKIALLTEQFPEWNLNQAITLFRADPNQLDFKYLFYVLCEGALVRKVMPETKGSVGQVNISLTQCREFLIALPPLDEQIEIVRQVDVFFNLASQIEKQVNSAQTRVNNLTQSILAKAFRGELTAKWREQNPDLISGENSAESLLKKIKEAREKLAQTKAKKKSAKKKVVA